MASRPHRPQRTDLSIVDGVAEQLVIALREDLQFLDMSDDVLTQAASSALALHSDGYDMAKFLEQGCGWKFICAETVSKLDGAAQLLTQMHRRAECDWVVANSITPKLRVGDQVAFAGKTGTILRIDGERAVYKFLPDDARSPIFATEVEFEYLDAITKVARQSDRSA